MNENDQDGKRPERILGGPNIGGGVVRSLLTSQAICKRLTRGTASATSQAILESCISARLGWYTLGCSGLYTDFCLAKPMRTV